MSPEHPGNLSYGPSFDKEHPNLDLPLSRLGSNFLSMGSDGVQFKPGSNTYQYNFWPWRVIGLLLAQTYWLGAGALPAISFKVKEVLP